MRFGFWFLLTCFSPVLLCLPIAIWPNMSAGAEMGFLIIGAIFIAFILNRLFDSVT